MKKHQQGKRGGGGAGGSNDRGKNPRAPQPVASVEDLIEEAEKALQKGCDT